MHIAICDDSKIDAKRIRWALMDVSSELEISYYASGKELLEAVRNGARIDAVFLDVYMPGENGVEVAEELNGMSPSTGIIFCTSSKEHAVEAFKVQAVDYIVKPCEEIDVVKAFARIRLAADAAKNAPVLIKSGGEVLVFRPEEIVRIESDKHYTVIITESGDEERVHMNYSEVTDKFKDGFLQVKRGITVRMDKIVRISGEEVILSDDSVFTLSRANKEDFIQSYMNYMEQRRKG